MTSTGEFDSWAGNPLDIGPMYPFVGWEMPMFVACVAVCVAMTIWKIVHEQHQYASEAKSLRQSGNGARILGLELPKNEPNQDDQSEEQMTDG